MDYYLRSEIKYFSAEYFGVIQYNLSIHNVLHFGYAYVKHNKVDYIDFPCGMGKILGKHNQYQYISFHRQVISSHCIIHIIQIHSGILQGMPLTCLLEDWCKMYET